MPGATPQERDAAFVHSEQTFVQGRLNAFKSESPLGYVALISTVNALLNNRQVQSADPNLGRAIRMATKEVGGPINFADQSHREAIGRSATKIARSSAPYCTGSRIRRC